MSLVQLCHLLASDAEADAKQLDQTPFDKQGVAEALGNILAQIAALAGICEAQQQQINDLIEVHGT